MRIKSNQNARSTGSRFRSVIGLGAASAIALAGALFIAVAPASASQGSLTFANVPASAISGVALSTFSVNIANGTGAPNDSILLSVAGTGCTLSGGTNPVTASSGTATFSDIVLTGGGTCTLTATDSTNGGTQTSSTISLAPTKLAFTSASPTAGTYAVALPTFQVSVVGPSGNVDTTLSADSIVISTATSGCTLGGTLTETTSSGVASFPNVIVTAGNSCVLTATDSTEPSLTTANTAAISMSTNTPTQVGFKTQPTGPIAAGTPLPSFTVAVEESNGVVVNATTGDADLITLTSACKLAGVTAEYAVAGIATFPDLIIDSSGSCVLTATDSTRALATANSNAVSVLAGTPTHLAFSTAPEAAVNGTGITLPAFVVAVEDANNNIVTTGTGASDQIVLSSACGLSGTTTEPATAGEATFTNVSFSGTGSCTITATDSSRTLTAATATTSVGEPQAALTLTSTGGYLDAPLTLVTKGGSGSGAVTYTVTNGTATGCTITSGTLRATTSGTCIVTATKAAASPYAAISTAATTVTISSAPLAQHLVGKVTIGHTSVVTISGYNFSGRPTAKSNVAGFTALVTKDTGRVLTVRITVKASSTKPGVKVMTLTFSNGKRTSFKYSLN